MSNRPGQPHQQERGGPPKPPQTAAIISINGASSMPEPPDPCNGQRPQAIQKTMAMKPRRRYTAILDCNKDKLIFAFSRGRRLIDLCKVYDLDKVGAEDIIRTELNRRRAA